MHPNTYCNKSFNNEHSNYFTKFYCRERVNLLLWIPIFFAAGILVFIEYFNLNHQINKKYYLLLMIVPTINFFYRSWLLNYAFFFACGLIYADFYHHNFLGYQKIQDSAFLNISGKVYATKIANNKTNIIIADPLIKQYNQVSVAKNKAKKTKAIKKTRKTKKSARKKSHKNNNSKAINKKDKKKYPFTENNILKNFINVANYQDIDRNFLDKIHKKAQLNWQNDLSLDNPPPFVSISIKNSSNIEVNDLINVNAIFYPSSKPDLPNSFDWQKYDNALKIGGYGSTIGDINIIQKAQYSNLDQYFLEIREKIKQKIVATIEQALISNIASALLIGDQQTIQKDAMQNIRNSGLSHIFSISGFHLGLASIIFFAMIRFLLAKNSFISINYNNKKIAAVFAVVASYFYLKIANSPLPAQRAFLIIAITMLSYLFSNKFHSKRAIFLSFFLLVIYNPYALYNLGFQLSFLAIIVLVVYYSDIKPKIFKPNLPVKNRHFLFKINQFIFFVWQYFVDIIILSILIQLLSLPLIMNSVQNFSTLGFVANIFAVPLTSFVVMPLGFIALILMPVNAHLVPLLAMAKSIQLLMMIADVVANFRIGDIAIANINTLYLPSMAMVVSLVGILLVVIHKGFLIPAVVMFFGGLSFAFFNKPANMIFLHNQKMAIFYDKQQNKMLFFGKFNNEQQKQRLTQRLSTDVEFIKHCDANNSICQICSKDDCFIKYYDHKILILQKTRQNLTILCNKINQVDFVVNFSRKYELPKKCNNSQKIKYIDNLDFLEKGTQQFYFDSS